MIDTRQPFLVIGIGNSLRGDDGVGPAVCDQLQSRAGELPIDFVIRHQLTPELVDELANRRGVLFIDACVNQPPGTWHYQRVRQSETQSPLAHQMDPGQLLSLCELCLGQRPRAWTLQFGADDFESIDRLSPILEVAVNKFMTTDAPRVIRLVSRL